MEPSDAHEWRERRAESRLRGAAAAAVAATQVACVHCICRCVGGCGRCTREMDERAARNAQSALMLIELSRRVGVWSAADLSQIASHEPMTNVE